MLNTNKRTMPAETKPCPRHHSPRHSPVRRTRNVVVPALFHFLALCSARIARVDRTVSCLFKMLAFLDAYCPHTIYAARRWTFAWYVALWYGLWSYDLSSVGVVRDFSCKATYYQDGRSNACPGERLDGLVPPTCIFDEAAGSKETLTPTFQRVPNDENRFRRCEPPFNAT